MPESFVYAFEDLPSDLPRPPMAAMRALLAIGMVLSPRGWAQLPLEVRQAITEAGGAEVLDGPRVETLVRRASVGELRLVPRLNVPPNDPLPVELVSALAAARRVTEAEWKALRPLDRHVLRSLILNKRLLWRAAQEILPEAVASSSQGLRGALAHVEVKMSRDAADLVRGTSFLDGRAFVLARVAGVRAARRASETYDLRADVGTGTIELDWTDLDDADGFLWQANVSTWEGGFYSAASLTAATTAATALCDMVRDVDPHATITVARIVDEDWRAGGAFQEHATAVYVGGAHRAGAAAVNQAATVARPTPPQHMPPTQTVASPGVVVAPRSGSLADASSSHPAARNRPTQKPPATQQALVIVILALLVLLLFVAVAILVVVARG